ncbi:YncE family protein [Actinomadura parmotrematis]|uniref:PQQ-binding-like beta-propeller repeat protein n=1 Tax=Actinomadura parmotrematis TaxID=2864039 RepID=A0ABS7FKU1_9ACTN|nr:hypothetical protein [Actinomadura parmotrematis]MBW8480977.1 hypothetical protein [Actinomadura parmotrematis]
MDVHACGHVAHAGDIRLCRHLLGPKGDEQDHLRLLRGRGLEYDLCCPACDEAGDPVLLEACEGCVDRVDGEGGALVGWRGEPGVRERPEPVAAGLVRTPLPGALGVPVDVAPIAAAPGSQWLLLTAAGEIVRFDAGTGEQRVVGTDPVPAEPDRKPWAGHALRRALHASADGAFAAVVNDHGRHGAVVDLATNAVTLTLDGGDHRPETVPFSLAFAEHAGRTVVLHRTAWNRLDAADAATGAPLTDRAGGGLDYFHGALHVSPDGRRVADDGWVWAPVGVVAAWDLERWLDGHPGEPEDGASLRRLCRRHYLWNVPMAWIAGDLLAVWGIGEDEIAMLDGVRVFDTVTGDEALAFPGPRGRLFADDRRLYAAAPGGLEVWDPYTGERTGAVPGFVPSWHHRGAGELAAVVDGELVRWPTG